MHWKDLRKTSFSVHAVSVGWIWNAVQQDARHLGFMCCVYLCTYYRVHAIKWFCQEPWFCGVFVAADLKIRRRIPDIIKSVIPIPWERGKKENSLCWCQSVFFLLPLLFPSRQSLFFDSLQFDRSLSSRHRGEQARGPSSRSVALDSYFFLLSHHFRKKEKKKRDFSRLQLLQNILPAPCVACAQFCLSSSSLITSVFSSAYGS